jgi:cyclopropane fatty-acyl-phospholipid synthase-like methyltransferase
MRLWDQEFTTGHWDFIDNTMGDCVYPYLERYSRNGRLLDLGCGPGNTANELAASAYQSYVGIDISEAALQKGRKRSETNGRGDKNRFELGDFISYAPSQPFDVILFRESMYHVPLKQVKAMLLRYSNYLTDGGVFIVRMVTSRSNGTDNRRLKSMVDIIVQEFEVVENRSDGNGGPTVVVFRPGRRA